MSKRDEVIQERIVKSEAKVSMAHKKIQLQNEISVRFVDSQLKAFFDKLQDDLNENLEYIKTHPIDSAPPKLTFWQKCKKILFMKLF